MELAEPAATDISSSSEQPKKKLNDQIRLYMANAFTADLKEEKKLQNALKEPRKRGSLRKGRCHQITRSANSEIPSCRDRVASPTVTEWINELMKAGRDENEKRDKELAAK